MKRNIISIDEDKCNGCGICVTACHEGAIQMVDGIAKLMTESYCDGLGDCLPECPTGAIAMENREAPEYDEAAVKANMAKAAQVQAEEKADAGCEDSDLPCGCPGSHSRSLGKKEAPMQQVQQAAPEAKSELSQWPVQIKLVPVNAPYFDNAKLLIAADCVGFAYANMHKDFIKGKITLIGCPKLDMIDYSEKLTEIIRQNEIKSVSVLRMSVPCCGGLTHMVKQAIINSGKMVPWEVTIVSPDGEIIDD